MKGSSTQVREKIRGIFNWTHDSYFIIMKNTSDNSSYQGEGTEAIKSGRLVLAVSDLSIFVSKGDWGRESRVRN